MSHFDAAVLTFLRRVGSRNFSVVSRISPTLLADLSSSSRRLITLHCSAEIYQFRRTEIDLTRPSHEYRDWGTTPHVVSWLPAILLFLALPSPGPKSAAAFAVQRFAVFTGAAFAPAPRVNTVICCLLRHVVPARYKDAPTLSLVLLVSVLGAAEQHGNSIQRWTRREGHTASVRQAEQENRLLTAAAATLPSWLQASIATMPHVDLTEVLDEVVHRLPPEGEMMPGDYVESLARAPESSTGQMFLEPLSEVMEKSSTEVVRQAELTFLMPKVVECGLRYDKACALAQFRQNDYLLDYVPPVERHPVYTPFARDAFARALSSMALLRHTKAIVAVRPLTSGELNFILNVTLCREPAWAETTNEALAVAVSDAEARRAEAVRESGKAEREVPLFGFIHAGHRRIMFSLLASRLCDLRFDLALLPSAVRRTMPLIREYCRMLATDHELAFRQLDREYHIKQMCIAASSIDLSCLSRDYSTGMGHEGSNRAEWQYTSGAEDDDDGEAEENPLQHAEPPKRFEGEGSPTGDVSVTCMLMDSLERFFTDETPPAPTIPSAAADAPTAPQRRVSGFGKAILDSDDADRELDGDVLLRITIIEGVAIYSKRRFAALPKGADAPEELTKMSLRTLRCLRLLIVKLTANTRRISGAIIRADARDPKVAREVLLRDSRAVRLLATAFILVGWLQRQPTLTEAQRCDAAEVLGLLIADLAGLLQELGKHRTPPPNLNRILAHVVRVRDSHQRLTLRRPLEGERGAAASDLVRDSTYKVIHEGLALIPRVLPSRSRQRAAAAGDANSATLLSTMVILGRATDRLVELGRTSDLTVVDMPHASEALTTIFEMTRAAFVLDGGRRSRNAERDAAEQATRSMSLFATVHLVYQVCNLSITNESCLAAMARTLEVCGEEKTIKGMPLERRLQTVQLISSAYGMLCQRFSTSKASRDAAEQLLIITYRMTLDSAAYTPPMSWNADMEPRMRTMALRLEVCKICIVMWQVACAAVPTLLPNGQVEKSVNAMLAYIKRNAVLPLELADLPSPDVPQTLEELEYCEERLVRAAAGVALCKTWRVATSKRAAVEQCIFLTGTISHALRRMDTHTFLEVGSHGNTHQRARWIQLSEASVEIFMRYQRWVAPSVWFAFWRNLKAIRVVAIGSRKTSASIDAGLATAQLRLLAYVKKHQNQGQWSPRRTMRVPVWSGEDDLTLRRENAGTGKDGADRPLLGTHEVARVLELPQFLTDVTQRLYVIELLDELLASSEEPLQQPFRHAVAPATRKVGLRHFDTIAESAEDAKRRRLRSALIQVLFNHRRIRS